MAFKFNIASPTPTTPEPIPEITFAIRIDEDGDLELCTRGANGEPIRHGEILFISCNDGRIYRYENVAKDLGLPTNSLGQIVDDDADDEDDD